MTGKSIAKRKARKKINTRRGVILIALLAVLILVVNLVVGSYSWFTPSAVTGKGLYYDDSSNLRSEDCRFATYQGVLVTDLNKEDYPDYYVDQIYYNTTPIAENAEITIPALTTTQINGETVTVPGRVYFRTAIENFSEKYSSVVSLYHHEMPADLYVGVTYPTNTYYHNDEAYPDYYIIRNAYVKVRDNNDADGPGLLPVEWFVENRSNTAKTIRVTNQTEGVDSPIPWLFLVYN